MSIRKCPRCELNYILDDGELCTVCREEVRGKQTRDDVSMICSVCGERPALAGEDMCKQCLAEIRPVEILSTDDGHDDASGGAELEPDSASSLDEMQPRGEALEKGIGRKMDAGIETDGAHGMYLEEDI